MNALLMIYFQSGSAAVHPARRDIHGSRSPPWT